MSRRRCVRWRTVERVILGSPGRHRSCWKLPLGVHPGQTLHGRSITHQAHVVEEGPMLLAVVTTASSWISRAPAKTVICHSPANGPAVRSAQRDGGAAALREDPGLLQLEPRAIRLERPVRGGIEEDIELAHLRRPARGSFPLADHHERRGIDALEYLLERLSLSSAIAMFSKSGFPSRRSITSLPVSSSPIGHSMLMCSSSVLTATPQAGSYFVRSTGTSRARRPRQTRTRPARRSRQGRGVVSWWGILAMARYVDSPLHRAIVNRRASPREGSRILASGKRSDFSSTRSTDQRILEY